jgi:glyoxylase-like metal-dependent hydrolase (beta-lactamase superfamily II)
VTAWALAGESMTRRFVHGLCAIALGAWATAQEPQPAATTRLRALPTSNHIVRTADVTVRGYTERDFPRITKIADHVYVYESLQHQPNIEPVFTTNCLIVVTREGVLIADGLQNEELVRRLVADVARLTPQPIKYLIVGADHGDHTGGNAAFPPGTVFLASTASKTRLDRRTTSRPITYQEVTQSKTTLHLGGTEIQILNLGRAHTGGDLEVYLPAQRILWMSEVFFNRLFPSTYTAYPSEWIATLRRAEAMQAWIYLPAHGFIDSRAVLNEELLNFRLCLERLVSEGQRLHDAQVPLENAERVAALGPYAYWTRAAYNLPDGLKRVYLQADGQLP